MRPGRKRRVIGSINRQIGDLKQRISQSMSDCGGYAKPKTRRLQRKMEGLRKRRRNLKYR